MESPKLREKQEELDLSMTMNNIEQSIILQNPMHSLSREKHRSKPLDTVSLY
jgi:hypothetical protein